MQAVKREAVIQNRILNKRIVCTNRRTMDFIRQFMVEKNTELREMR